MTATGIKKVKKASFESQELKPPFDWRLLFLAGSVIACVVLGFAAAIHEREISAMNRRFDETEKEIESFRKALNFETDIEQSHAQKIHQAIVEAIKKWK
jgi:hypothetical protein